MSHISPLKDAMKNNNKTFSTIIVVLSDYSIFQSLPSEIVILGQIHYKINASQRVVGLLGKTEIAGPSPALAFKFQRNKMFLHISLVMIQYCGEPP